MKHRKPARARHVIAKGTLPIAAAAAAASIWAGQAGAVPNETPTTPPPTSTPKQPGVNSPSTPSPTTPAPQPSPATPSPATPAPQQPGTTPAPQQPGTSPQQPGTSQPGVTNPADPTKPKDPNMATPSQPGVTTPSVTPPMAPLPVPGQKEQAVVPPLQDQVVTPTPVPGQPQQQQPQQQPVLTPEQPAVVQPSPYRVPSNPSAPPAPVVPMKGQHVEVQANVEGGPVAPGVVANTHHFGNSAGYVGTAGFRTPTGTGEAGIAVDTTNPDIVKVTTYTKANATEPQKNSFEIDVRPAKAAEQWVRMQPGGNAVVDAIQSVKLPVIPEGGLAPQKVNVGGVVVDWGGSAQL